MYRRHPCAVRHVGVDVRVGQEEGDQVGVARPHRLVQRAPAPWPPGEVGVPFVALQDADHIAHTALLTRTQQPGRQRGVTGAPLLFRITVTSNFTRSVVLEVQKEIPVSNAKKFHLLHINDTMIFNIQYTYKDEKLNIVSVNKSVIHK